MSTRAQITGRNAHIAAEIKRAKAPLVGAIDEDAAAWMEQLGSKFVVVWLYLPKSTTVTSRGSGWLDEKHINDPETLETTVSMSLERLGGHYALWSAPGGDWNLLKRRSMGEGPMTQM